MEPVTNWAALWSQLAEMMNRNRHGGVFAKKGVDPWKERARDFDAIAKRRMEEPDPIRDVIFSSLTPEATVLDIGAGSGRWAVLMAPKVHHVTAVDPSKAMLGLLRQNLAIEGVQNVNVVPGAWPDVEVSPHDISLCSHAMYNTTDFPRFIRRMVEVTRRTIYLLMRMPAPNGVMSEAALRFWRQPHDSPNFVVGYNALLDMGIFANVLVANRFRPWTSASFDEALKDLKERLGLANSSEHDDELHSMLTRRLVLEDGRYVWPDGMRTALIYWNVGVNP